MKKYLIVLLLVFCSNAGFAQRQLFEDLRKQSSYVVRATAIERGRCVRMEDGVNFCSFRFVVNESFKGALKASDSIWVKVTLYGYIGLGGKFLSTDSIPYCTVGNEYVLFLGKHENPFDNARRDYELVDDILGLQPACEQVLWYLRYADEE